MNYSVQNPYGGGTGIAVPRRSTRDAALTPSDMRLGDLIEILKPQIADEAKRARGYDTDSSILIAEGGYGRIYDIRWRGRKVALKEFDIEYSTRPEVLKKNENAVKNEIYALTRLRHPNLIGMMDGFAIPSFGRLAYM